MQGLGCYLAARPELPLAVKLVQGQLEQPALLVPAAPGCLAHWEVERLALRLAVGWVALLALHPLDSLAGYSPAAE